jgi:uncharacterized damage-inducible protein DinB
MLKKQLSKLAQYNVWANNTLIDFAIEAGDEKTDQILKSSFDTIRKTLYHIYDAETVWLLRLTAKPLEYWPPSRDFSYSLLEFKPILMQRSSDLLQLLNSFSSESIKGDLVFTDTKGNEFRQPIADIFQHVLNHSTYHRGQLITMLRLVGYTSVGSTDYINWCRKHYKEQV